MFAPGGESVIEIFEGNESVPVSVAESEEPGKFVCLRAVTCHVLRGEEVCEGDLVTLPLREQPPQPLLTGHLPPLVFAAHGQQVLHSDDIPPA